MNPISKTNYWKLFNGKDGDKRQWGMSKGEQIKMYFSQHNDIRNKWHP
jgi:hypothetical protein